MAVPQVSQVRIAERTADSLDRFVTDVGRLREVHQGDAHTLAGAVAESLAGLLRDPHWLCKTHREGWSDRYRQHVLYVAPDGGFSVVSLVWQPGQETAIHDHICWCVVGVYRGEEEETRYHLHEVGGERCLVPVAVQRAQAGTTVALVSPEEDIHRVRNAGDGAAISIHVYGADIGKLGTSINQRFDHLPIRASSEATSRVHWRTEKLGLRVGD